MFRRLTVATWHSGSNGFAGLLSSRIRDGLEAHPTFLMGALRRAHARENQP